MEQTEQRRKSEAQREAVRRGRRREELQGKLARGEPLTGSEREELELLNRERSS